MCLQKWLQVFLRGKAGGDRAAGAVREQVGEDRHLPAGQEGLRRQELLEHSPEAAFQAPARASPRPVQQEQQQRQSACLLSRVATRHGSLPGSSSIRGQLFRCPLLRGCTVHGLPGCRTDPARSDRLWIPQFRGTIAASGSSSTGH